MVQAPAVNGNQLVQRRKELRSEDGMQNYCDYFANGKVDQLGQGTIEQESKRIKEYKNVVASYYDGVTDIFEQGWGQSFHFCTFYRGEPFGQAIARHQHYLALRIGITPGSRVLDAGCGVGGPATEIARFTGAHVTGVTICKYQVAKANRYAAEKGLSKQLQFVHADFMSLVDTFGENSFDHVFVVEATVHAPDWLACYTQIMRVLKPGGTFGVYEWCMTDRYDPADAKHVELARQIEFGDGIPQLRTIADCKAAIKGTGMEIVFEEDLAEREMGKPWYYPLSGDIRQVQSFMDIFTVIRTSSVAMWLSCLFVGLLELLRLAPKGTRACVKSLTVAAWSLSEAGQLKIFTPMMLVVARKPLAAE
ncbi:uncharacterized protein L969DRAFT_460441 [Mixia osmundae IAM 14324]|uniref:Sterol 24-C-methyltransferase n=1 Tax=Mixia osmundae (strain CBS 9802 / IAM 14324 / JCM 22182 / KY 12970) TaxID=764103 RepID=G7DVP5_MIXOS|nr:uncharacterized protein L969DRAFT_460441 [Mixia osmundae IAM 14324]KEI39663.1 hypothetical protein L969DRAFT_460441 [Mixia osmundae IAM 14324]GAA94655.1 hypothetical protein E5Q_01308 [Mixia osmundae IAM 14324]